MELRMSSSTLNIFGKSLSFYVLFAFIGMSAGILIALAICKKRNLPSAFVFRMVLGVLFIGFTTQAFVSQIPDFMLTYGYLLGLILATVLFAVIGKIWRYNPKHCCEIGLIATNTFMIFSKTGCFFAGCCHGLPYDGLLSVIYGSGTHAYLQGVPLFPIQLAEVAVRIAVLAFMLLLLYKRFFEKYKIPLYFCFMGICYYWGMLFWYGPMKTVNQNGINFILIFNILFGIGTAAFLCLSAADEIKRRKSFKI